MNIVCKVLSDAAAFFVVLVFALVLAGCGGSEHVDEVSEADRLTQFCEAQGLDAQLLQVYNVDSGESYLDVQCVKPKIEVKYCKVGGDC